MTLKILGTTAQNLVARATRRADFCALDTYRIASQDVITVIF